MDIYNIIKNNDQKAIFDIINKTTKQRSTDVSPSPSLKLLDDHYNIEDKIEKLTAIPSVIQKINSLPIEKIEELLKYYDDDLDHNSNGKIRMNIAHTLNGTNALQFLENMTESFLLFEEVLIIILLRCLRRGGFLRKIQGFCNTRDIDKFFSFMKDKSAFLDVIKKLQKIDNVLKKKTFDFKVFSKLFDKKGIGADTLMVIQKSVIPLKEGVLAERLKGLIISLCEVYKTHKAFYTEQEEIQEEYFAIQNQLGLPDEDPFEAHKKRYKESKSIEGFKSKSKSNSKSKPKSKSVSFGDQRMLFKS